MGNKRSRLASKGGGWGRVHAARELARQQQAARVLYGSGRLQPPPTPAKLRRLGLMFILAAGLVAALVGAGAALLVHR